MKLPDDDPDKQHLIHCSLPLEACSRCHWTMRKTEWQDRCPWLFATGTGESWTLRCQCCLSAGLKGVFSTGIVNRRLQLSLFNNHSSSNMHQKALAIARGTDPDELDVEKAPPADHFGKLLAAIRAGKAHGESGCEGVGRRKKCRNMKFCLAEAKRCRVRSALQSASAIAIHQDGRKGRLAIRFAACSDGLAVSRGVLGSADLAKNFTLSGIGMRDATLSIMQHISTPVHRVPFRSDNDDPDIAVLSNIFKKLEMFSADAAEDEQVAGKLLRGARAADGQDFSDLFPNLKILNKDKPHGSRRMPGVRASTCSERFALKQTIGIHRQGNDTTKHAQRILVHDTSTERRNDTRHRLI